MRMIRNKILHLLLAAVCVMGSFCACDEAEVGLEYSGTFLNVFDVKKSFVYPTFSDTSYVVMNKADFPQLTTECRAYMELRYDFDVYAMNKPEMSISNVVSLVPINSMTRKENVKVQNYNSPFYSVENYIAFYDMSGNLCPLEDAKFMWADSITQNVAVRYKQPLNLEHRMTVDSLRGDTLFFRLYASLNDKEWEEPVNEVYQYTKFPTINNRILSYKMDWDMIFSELTEAEQAEIVKIDSLTSNIALVVEECRKDANGLYIPAKGRTNDWFKNGLYKRK